MQRTPSVRVLLALALLTGALFAPTASADSATCRARPVSADLKLDLRRAHKKVTDRGFWGPTKVLLGRCDSDAGTKFYALAWFKDKELGYQDQPERFTRRKGQGWKDLGDTGGPPCDTGFPKALLRAWGYDC